MTLGPTSAGEAAAFRPDDDVDPADPGLRVALSANSRHALEAFGIAARLAELAEGTAGEWVLFPAVLDRAIALAHEADRDTYGREVEIALRGTGHAAPRRLRLDRREYQRTLARLVFLFRSARDRGWAVRLRLACDVSATLVP